MYLSTTYRGLGNVPATTSGIISATGTAAGGTLITVLPLLGVAGPVGAAIGAGVVLVSQLLGLFGVGDGCGQSCVVASNTANEIERQMKANLAAFQAGQIDRKTALSNFDILWNGLVQTCEQIGGGAGTNCIDDRKEGACKWRDTSGQCWNWFSGYRAPIYDAAAASNSPTAALSSIIGNLTLAEWAVLGLLSFGIAEAM